MHSRKNCVPLLVRCEWGHDDYSLNVANLPLAEPSPPAPAAKAAKSGRKPSDSRTTDMFGDGGDA